jgi:hypothetical protein
MRLAWILALSLAVAGSAAAQMYKWVDKDGKVRYGDTPPPGAKTSTVAAPSPPASGAPAAKDAKDAGKRPLTAAEQEQAYRMRQAEEKKAAEKADVARAKEAERAGNCERSREWVRTLQTGQRIARTDANGERIYMTDEQVAAELGKAQKSVQDNCN